MIARLTDVAGALLAGAICLVILSGVLVVHAWPLWTGETVILPVVPIDPRDLFRGEYVRLATPANRLVIRNPAAMPGTTADAGLTADLGGIQVEADSSWIGPRAGTSLVDTVVYVQLEERGAAGESQPVAISREPKSGRLNLRGRVSRYDEGSRIVSVEYGLDRYYMAEGAARQVEAAIRDRRRVQMEIAVASSGRARIRGLLVDGVAQ